MARTMLDEHRTPRKYWAEAVSTACYVSNRIFLRAFMHKTFYELRFGRQPHVDHLRVFGCRCFVLKEGNLDKEILISLSLDRLIGYASHSRAYRVLIIDTNIVRETCEVTFDETAPCNSSVFEVAGDDELGTPILKMRRKKLRRVMLRLPHVLWTQPPPPRARTLMTAPTRLHPLPGGRSSR